MKPPNSKPSRRLISSRRMSTKAFIRAGLYRPVTDATSTGMGSKYHLGSTRLIFPAVRSSPHNQCALPAIPSPKHAAPGGCHGEQYHSQDGLRGGLWRFSNRSSASLIGLESAGWAFAEPEDFGVYRVSDASHFLFRVPEDTGLASGASFGHGFGQALPRAIGHEWDLTIPTLRCMTPRTPADGELPADPVGVHVLAQGVRAVPGKLDAYMDFFEGATQSLDGVSAEMIYWERPQGGRVFNAGAVGASWVLGVDKTFGTLIRNVLHHFGIRPA